MKLYLVRHDDMEYQEPIRLCRNRDVADAWADYYGGVVDVLDVDEADDDTPVLAARQKRRRAREELDARNKAEMDRILNKQQRGEALTMGENFELLNLSAWSRSLITHIKFGDLLATRTPHIVQRYNTTPEDTPHDR